MRECNRKKAQEKGAEDGGHRGDETRRAEPRTYRATEKRGAPREQRERENEAPTTSKRENETTDEYMPCPRGKRDRTADS